MTAVDLAPGRYDLPADAYHADPVPGGSLSSTGARKLLPPSCPALFRHWQQHPEPPSDAFDFGTVVHTLVLGHGTDVEVVHARDWKTKPAQEAKARIRAAGRVPLLPQQYDAASTACAAVRAHPIANALFTGGQAEQTLVWRDDDSGVVCRAMLDYLRDDYVIDLKTCQSAHPTAIGKSVAAYGYHQQAAHYLAGVRALGISTQPRFLFVFVEKEPPHLVTVAQPDSEALDVGAALNRRALEVYRDCLAADVWPGHSTDVELVSLPRWAVRDFTWEYS